MLASVTSAAAFPNQAEAEDGGLTHEELYALIIQLFFAGFETTEGIIGNALDVLLRQRDMFAALRGDPGCAGLVTEEILR